MSKKNSETVSIIVPVYNAEKYLSDCIESIINQSYNDLDIILVDDGSTDGSGKICEKYANFDSRITVLHKRNEGVAKARNDALKIAKGKYALFVDADDEISSKMCEICVKAISDVDIVIFPYTDKRTQLYTDEIKREMEFYFDNQYAMEEFLRGHNGKRLFRGLCWNKMYRMEMINGIEFPDGQSYGKDSFFTYCVFKKIHKIKYLNDAKLYFYRFVDNSAIHKSLTISLTEIIDTYNYIKSDNTMVDSDYVIYAYCERLFDIVARVKSDLDNYDVKRAYLMVLKLKVQLSYTEIINCKSLTIKMKILIMIFKINIDCFMKIYSV